MQDIITNVIVALINVALVAIVAYIGKVSISNSKEATGVNKALSLVEALVPVAKDAVTVAEKQGALNGWSGDKEKTYAISVATKTLSNLGFTTADQTTIANAIEQAWVTLKSTLEEAYSNSASTVTDTKLEQANAKLADAKEQVAKAQAINDAVQKAIATATASTDTDTVAAQSATDVSATSQTDTTATTAPTTSQNTATATTASEDATTATTK